ASWRSEQRRVEHLTVIEGEQEIGLCGGNPGDDLSGVAVNWRDRPNVIFRSSASDTFEPNLFVRVVFVGDDQRQFDALRQQDLQTAHTYIVVGKDNGTSHGKLVAKKCSGAELKLMMAVAAQGRFSVGLPVDR